MDRERGIDFVRRLEWEILSKTAPPENETTNMSTPVRPRPMVARLKPPRSKKKRIMSAREKLQRFGHIQKEDVTPPKTTKKGSSLVRKLLRGKFEDPKKLSSAPPKTNQGGQTVPIGVFTETSNERLSVYRDEAKKSQKRAIEMTQSPHLPDRKRGARTYFKRWSGIRNAENKLYRHEEVEDILNTLEISLTTEQINVLKEGYGSTAAKVRKSKEKHPEYYCKEKGCLWQVITPRGPNPCKKHPLANPSTDKTPASN